MLTWQSQHLTKVLDDALQSVSADGARQNRMLRTEMPVYALDQRIPDAPWEVQVYVWKRSDILGDKTLQAQVPHQRVDVADADEIPHKQRDG